MNCAGLSNNCFDKSGIIEIFVSLHDKYALFFSVDHNQLSMCARSKIDRRIFFPFPETISVKQFAVMRDGRARAVRPIVAEKTFAFVNAFV